MRKINYDTTGSYVKAVREAADYIESQIRNEEPIGYKSMKQYAGRSIIKKAAYSVCVSALINNNFNYIFNSNWEASKVAGENKDITPMPDSLIAKNLKVFKQNEAYKILEYPKYMWNWKDTIQGCILRYKNGTGIMFKLSIDPDKNVIVKESAVGVMAN